MVLGVLCVVLEIWTKVVHVGKHLIHCILWPQNNYNLDVGSLSSWCFLNSFSFCFCLTVSSIFILKSWIFFLWLLSFISGLIFSPLFVLLFGPVTSNYSVLRVVSFLVSAQNLLLLFSFQWITLRCCFEVFILEVRKYSSLASSSLYLVRCGTWGVRSGFV